MRSESVKSMIRVDHAGEYAAVCIYHGQEMALKGTSEVHEIRKMKEHEQVHFKYFDDLLKEKRVRPTIFLPVWHVASVLLGYTTALMGKEAAMACTAAVEEVICEHYNDQAVQLDNSESELRDKIAQFCDEEREHMTIAVDHGAENAPAYDLLSRVVKTGCKIAITISKVL